VLFAVLPLFGVLFGAPLAAAAAAVGAVSIPVIIHLLNRRRYKVVVWAAMRFLLSAQRKNSRRMRLERASRPGPRPSGTGSTPRGAWPRPSAGRGGTR
jgi:hypothetical protein